MTIEVTSNATLTYIRVTDLILDNLAEAGIGDLYGEHATLVRRYELEEPHYYSELFGPENVDTIIRVLFPLGPDDAIYLFS